MTPQPRTRLEEIARARGIRQKELAERGGWHPSNLNRLFSGSVALSDLHRQRAARELNCPEWALIEEIGTPIPPPGRRSRTLPGATLPGFERRVEALLFQLHVNTIEDLLLFLISGDYSRLQEKLARRLRDTLRELDAADDADSSGGAVMELVDHRSNAAVDGDKPVRMKRVDGKVILSDPL